MRKTKLGQIARECRATWTASKNGVPIVGLEHLVPGEITLSTWEIDSDNTFNKKFSKGQVLLGRRRVYLRKAAIAPFDGICSGDITVIEAIPNKILPEMLPFIIQNDAFFDYAMQGSAGSLSPRVKWEHLANYEFSIPTIPEQKILTDKLWAAYRLKESYKKLLATTDEMVKSQFIEMFMDKGYPMVAIKSFADITTGSTPSKSHPEYWGGNFPWVSAEDMREKYVYTSCKRLTEAGYKTCKHLPVDTLMYVCRGSIGVISINKIECATNQSICTATCHEKICNVEFLYHALLYKKNDIKKIGTGTSFKSLNQSAFSELTVILPPIEEQMKFVAIAQQADKSKFVELKSQFIEMFENSPKTKLSDFCELKARIGWQGLKHEEFLDEGDYYLVTGVDFDGKSINWSRCHYVTKDRYDQDTNIQLHNGDVLVTKDGTIGKVAIVSGLDGPATLNSGVFVLRDKKGLTLNRFLFYCLLTKDFEKFIEDCKTGSTIAHLNQKAFVNYFIPTPGLALQEKFVTIAEQADKSK
ncbi:MAG: restriction endonuclease subunit S [Bacteroidaceae bacterium]|nr:restriction endonuclease subunit S [Bacteroidaceae bacterium]